ncbi:hypothetical protein [Streptomyces lavendofoliae]|uniref:Uncharacterized protein n=1 Tax=Streptomyces lavendofoliae TaxID=67314 RepID=A0A918I3D6_9ACTN|nr:hypothetical protein [Streptomyces lavendofoliae]GGU62572.1 hypothetical protein GCM10010274_59210 [Streptomyces lavendofoliae]
MASTDPVIPPLDDLGDALHDLDGFRWLPGIAQILDGIETAATTPLTADQTQTMCAVLAGSTGADVLTLIGLLIQRLTTPATNPALRALPDTQAKAAQAAGEKAAYLLTAHDLHQPAAEAAGAIDGI